MTRRWTSSCRCHRERVDPGAGAGEPTRDRAGAGYRRPPGHDPRRRAASVGSGTGSATGTSTSWRTACGPPTRAGPAAIGASSSRRAPVDSPREASRGRYPGSRPAPRPPLFLELQGNRPRGLGRRLAGSLASLAIHRTILLYMDNLDAEVRDLSMHQPGHNPQADCAHHQQHSVHSVRIGALL
jgi:hypothetical protein